MSNTKFTNALLDCDEEILSSLCETVSLEDARKAFDTLCNKWIFLENIVEKQYDLYIFYFTILRNRGMNFTFNDILVNLRFL